MKRLLATLLSAALLAAPLFAQQNDEEQKALQRQIRVQNLQSQLEDLRRKRDKMVVDRWEERRAANEKRENLNRKIDEARSALEQAGERKSRLMDDIRAVQGEVAQGQQSVESSRARFLSLSEQSGKLQELRQLADEGLRLDEPERIARYGRTERSVALLKDKPEQVFALLWNDAVRDIRESRAVELVEGEFLAGEKLRPGKMLRLGNVLALREVPTAELPEAALLTKVEKNRRAFRWRDRLDETAAGEIRAAFAALEAGGDSSRTVLVPGDILLAPLELGDGSSEEAGGVAGYLADLFRKGGILSWPIVALAAIALLLALERAVVLCLLARRNEKRLRELFAGIVERSADRGQAEDAVEEVLARENPKFERHLSTISTLGGAAPLLGLLGTVLGMIQLFDVITRYGTSDPKLLAGGIAVALVTTQMGLMVAIPVMLLHNALANRADLLSARTEEAAIAALNARFGSEKR